MDEAMRKCFETIYRAQVTTMVALGAIIQEMNISQKVADEVFDHAKKLLEKEITNKRSGGHG